MIIEPGTCSFTGVAEMHAQVELKEYLRNKDHFVGIKPWMPRKHFSVAAFAAAVNPLLRVITLETNRRAANKKKKS